jgi:hypothetical protein
MQRTSRKWPRPFTASQIADLKFQTETEILESKI